MLVKAYEAEATFAAMSLAEWTELRRETLDYVALLEASGHLLLTNALQSARTAQTLRVRDGKVAVTDGPFIETKEQLGGFFLIEACDMEEAMAIAARWPGARFGDIEVRPVEDGLNEARRY
jgi:hypothetical protein